MAARSASSQRTPSRVGVPGDRLGAGFLTAAIRPIADAVVFPFEVPSAASNPRRESLGAGCAGVRLLGSAADNEQADDEDEDNKLEGDAYGVLEAALQTLVADGEP